MSVTTTDARSKAVSNQLVDKYSTIFPLSNIFTDMGAAMKLSESIDIPTRSALSVEQVSNSSGLQAMTVQTQSPTANTLTVDQHYGSVLEIPALQDIFDLEGSWSSQVAEQILGEISDYIDIDVYTKAIKQGSWVTGSTASYWVNAAGAALTYTMVQQAVATMTSQKGVRYGGLVWVFHPWGIGALRILSAFTPHENVVVGAMGMPVIGTLDGIPVVMSQSVPTSITAATTAVTIATNVATITVASGHGFSPGMKVTTSGLTTNISVAATITSTTDTTIVVPLTAADGAFADGIGVVTCAMTFNSLVHRPWCFVRKTRLPKNKIVAKSGGKIGDELQSEAIWGRKVLAGAVVGLGSPQLAFS